MTATGICEITTREQLPLYMENVERRINSRGGSHQITLTVADVSQAALLIDAYNYHFRDADIVWLHGTITTYPFKLVARVTTRACLVRIVAAKRIPLPGDEEEF
jgi:hypothetical protein